MAHYAFLNNQGIVLKVIVGKDENDELYDWEKYYSQIEGLECKRTSFNTHGGLHDNNGIPYRKNYAGIGYLYDPIRDAFIPPKPFSSWLLNEETCLWEAPIEKPNNGLFYYWDENALSWIEIN